MATALLAGAFAAYAEAQERGESFAERQAVKRGLLLNSDAASAGYTLFAPIGSTTTYLVDLQGRLVHSWPSKYVPGQAVYLLEDGSVLRSARQPRNRHFGGGGIGGRIERIAADGKLLWEYVLANRRHCQHHDIKPMPNGHVLLIAWEKKTRDQAVATGRDPEEASGNEIWPDCVLEVDPQGASGGRIVWEWHVWDHLVQDFDSSKPNYGVVAEHPELIDLNYRRMGPPVGPAELERLRSLGYVGGRGPEEGNEDGEEPPPFGTAPGGPDMRADWCHTNSLDYNAKLDQIALSVHSFNEIWVIDHSTTTKEAAGHRGGRQGKGGDLLYRWGNPHAYRAGDVKDQTLFAQHDVRWIPEGSPGGGHLMVFNNGPGRPDGPYSSIVEIAPPIDSSGRYHLAPGKAFGPPKAAWEYTAANKTDFFSGHISGAHRLPNGNTLICSGEQGRIFEVNAGGKTVWEYVNPYIEHEGPDEGFPPPGVWLAAWLGNRRGSGDADGRPRTPPGRMNRPPRPPGAPAGPPGGPGGPPGGDPGGGLFRATRLPPDHPGIRCVLAEIKAKEKADN